MNGFESNAASDFLIVVRAMHFAATAVIAGTLLFRMVIARPALHLARPVANVVEAQILRVAWICIVISFVSGAAWILLQVPAMSGLPFREAMTGDVIGTVLTETQFGLVTELRSVLAVIVAACLTYDRYPMARSLGLMSSLCLVASIAATGHAGATEGSAGLAHLAADAVHLVASGAWIGGLVSLALLTTITRRYDPHGWPSLVRDATLRFSNLGLLSVGALLATGMVNGAILVGSVHALLVTMYGQLLVLKIALFAAMLVIAAVNRFWLLPQLASVPASERELDAARKLTRNCVVEVALGLMIFAIVGALGTIHPAIHLG
jgi:copper resistance protein D